MLFSGFPLLFSKKQGLEGQGGEGNLAGNLAGILRDFFFAGPQNKGSNISGEISEHFFREKIRASKKIFRANFVLQTCHPKKQKKAEAREFGLPQMGV